MTAATRSESSTKTLAILLVGVLTGALVTTGLVLAAARAIKGDSPSQSMPAPSFREESATSGITQVYDGEFQYFVGGGAAVFDCNDDHLPDLYLAGGVNPAALYVNTSEVGGDLVFKDSTDATTAITQVTGAYPIDIDSDGLTDLAVLRVGENVLLRGTGACTFEEANDLWGLDGGNEWTAAFSATWEDDQDMPTLAFGNYLALQESGERDRCEDQFLFRPGGAKYHEPVTLSPGWCTLSILFSDWSGDGQRDLRMTNDRHYYRDGREQLWNISADGSPTLYTESQGWQTMQIWGMGIASQDLTGDGRPEVFLTSQGDNKLQTLADNSGDPTYEDMALAAGVTAHRPFIGDTNRPSTAWHAEFGDVNNDGFVDLFVTKGNVDAMPEFAMEDPNNLLLGQPDGTFTEGAGEAGLLDYERSRGGALADLNDDGLLDVLVMERREPVRVWRNTGRAGNWLAVEVRQPGSNLHAVGGLVEVRIGNTTTRTEITVGGGHAGGELGPIHFGLGSAPAADVRVVWPDGTATAWRSFGANQTVTVEREP